MPLAEILDTLCHRRIGRERARAMSRSDTIRYCLHTKGVVASDWFKIDPKSGFSGNVLFADGNAERGLLTPWTDL